MSKKDEKNPYLVEFTATVGRSTKDAEHPPVYLSYFAIVEAKDSDAAQDQLTQYSDPTFTAKVVNIQPLDLDATKELIEKLALAKVMTENLNR